MIENLQKIWDHYSEQFIITVKGQMKQYAFFNIFLKVETDNENLRQAEMFN